MGRLAREQIVGVETFGETYVHPDGVGWELVGALSIPGTINRAIRVHASLRMRKVGSTEGMVATRVLPLVVCDDAGGGVQVEIVGAIGTTDSPGESVSYQSDLAGADMQFSVSAGLSDVSVSVNARWPAMVGGQSIYTVCDVWWE